MKLTIALLVLLAPALLAEDFSLTVDGIGPITVHSALSREGKGERLIATAKNESGDTIPYVKLCLTVNTNDCLFEMWTTREWKDGESLDWDLSTAKRVPALKYRVVIYGDQIEYGPDAEDGPKPKGKPRAVIEVVGIDLQQVTVPYVIPGSAGYSSTNCNSTGTATRIGSTVSANGNANCTTNGRPGTAAQGIPLSIPLRTVLAVMPDGHHIAIRCQNPLRGCASLEVGSYEAELEGNSLWVHAHRLDGTKLKVKYIYIGAW